MSQNNQVIHKNLLGSAMIKEEKYIILSTKSFDFIWWD